MSIVRSVFACAALLIATGIVNAQDATNQSSVAQGICTSGKNYWFQRMKMKNGSLCTKFSFDQFVSVPILWNPKWNAEAKKHYCPGSEKDTCFISN